MKLILSLALVCVLVCQLLDASPVIEDRDQDAKYEDHKKTQGLTFTGEEDDRRRAEFKATDDHINAHNADPTKTSTLVHNQLSTMHAHEVATMNGYKQTDYTPPTEPASSRMIADRSEPTNLDWRDNNGDYLSPIQSQGQCGSCWTFSATATLESRWAINHGLTTPIKLSEQCLVDCAHYGTTKANTCRTGGNYNTAWSWVAGIAGQYIGGGTITGTNSAALPKPTTGQNLESKYPYVDSNYKSGDAAHSCGFAVSKGNDVSSSLHTTTTAASKYCSWWSTPWSWTSSTGWVAGTKYCSEYTHTAATTTYHGAYSITANSPSAMKTALQSGPVSVSIYAGGSSFQQYGSGILQEADCPGTDLDHAVNLIGYGEDGSGNLYWLGRNSWGTWGDEGYFKFERKTTESVGTCGVLREGAYPVM